MAERTYITGIWRASQAAYRPWVTTLHPRATLDMIPPTVKVQLHRRCLRLQSLGEASDDLVHCEGPSWQERQLEKRIHGVL